MSGLGDGTRAVRAGLPEPGQGQPFLPGPEFAAPFAVQGDPKDAHYVYGRYGNPTWSRVEQGLGELEGGRPCCSPPAWPRWRRCSSPNSTVRRRSWCPQTAT